MAAKAKKIKKEVGLGRIYISASFNNTLVTITNAQGETLTWGSSGASGFKGTRRATPYAATTAVETVLNKAKNDFGQVATALSAYFTSNSTYPVGATWATLDALETSEDLKAVPDGATGYTYSCSGNATNAALWVTLKSPKVSSLPVLCWRSATGGFTEVAAASCAP